LRLDFNVLWVDDQPDRVKAQIEGISRRMRREGFNFQPTLCTTLEQVEEFIAEDVFQDEIDLILVDWDLGGGLEGQDVIYEIRQKALYKDVVFYSALTPLLKLRQLAFKNEIEGIYCASRDGLVEEVEGIFESLVKKVLDLDHTRGIVMGATSDIDDMVCSCLVKIEEYSNDKDKEKVVKQALMRVTKRVKDLNRQGRKIESASSIQEVLKYHMIFDARTRLQLLMRLLEKDENRVDEVTTVKNYMENVIGERNMLGHMVLEPEGKPHIVVADNGKKVRLEEMRDLRRLILDFREKFRELTKSLG